MASSEETSEVEQLAAQLEAKIHLEDELNSTKTQLEQERRSSMQKAEEIQNLKSLLDHHSDHMESLNATLEDLEARNSVLKMSVDKQDPNNASSACVEELEAKLKASEAQLKHWENTVVTFQNDVVGKLTGLKQKWKGCVDERNKEFETLENEKSTLKSSNTKLQEDLEAKEKELAETNTVVEAQNSENEEVKKAVSNLKEEHEEAQKEIASLKEVNDEAQKEIANLTEENGEAKKEISDLKSTVSHLEGKVEEAIKDLEDSKQIHKDVLESLKGEHAKDQNELKSNSEQLQGEVDDLEEQIKAMGDHKNAIDDLKEQMQKKNQTVEEKVKLAQKLEKMNQTLTRDFKSVQATVLKLESDQNKFLETQKKVQADKEEFEKQVGVLSAENSKLSNKYKDSDKQLENVKRKLENCQRSLEEKTNEKKHQSQKNQGLLNDVKSLKKQLDKAQKRVDELEGPAELMRQESEKKLKNMRSEHKVAIKKLNAKTKIRVEQAKARSKIMVKGYGNKHIALVMVAELAVIYLAYAVITAMG